MDEMSIEGRAGTGEFDPLAISWSQDSVWESKFRFGLLTDHQSANRSFCIHVDGVAMDEMAEDGFGLWVGFIHPADGEQVGVMLVAFLVMDFTVDMRKERQNILDLVIDHAFEFG